MDTARVIHISFVHILYVMRYILSMYAGMCEDGERWCFLHAMNTNQRQIPLEDADMEMSSPGRRFE